MDRTAAASENVKGWEWRYLPHGNVKHAVSRFGGNLSGFSSMAECGRHAPSSGDWRGSGSQREYERVAELPACRGCAALGYS